MPDTYLLRWQDTQYGQQPKPAEVERWLELQGLEPAGEVKVWANGDVRVTCGQDPTERWALFEPPVLTQEDRLGGHIKALLTEREALLAIPESKRTPTERALLATMALLMYGYGVEDA